MHIVQFHHFLSLTTCVEQRLWVAASKYFDRAINSAIFPSAYMFLFFSSLFCCLSISKILVFCACWSTTMIVAIARIFRGFNFRTNALYVNETEWVEMWIKNKKYGRKRGRSSCDEDVKTDFPDETTDSPVCTCNLFVKTLFRFSEAAAFLWKEK